MRIHLIAVVATVAAILPFSSIADSVIDVVSATYGSNCGVPKGNITRHVANSCGGQKACIYRVDHKVVGDPARGCKKAFEVSYVCRAGRWRKTIDPEASGKTARLGCNKSNLSIREATYGANCGVSAGNVTRHVAGVCSGNRSCSYKIDHKVIGDPAKGCAKDFVIRYQCGSGSSGQYDGELRPEASGSSIRLDCG